LTDALALSHDELAALDEPRLRTAIPGPKAKAVIRQDDRVTSPSLPRAYAFVPDRGAGAMIEDVDGNVFLDFNAGIAVCSTGHAHPAVVEAIREQAGRLLHFSASDFFLPIYADLCERLDEIAPMTGPTRSFLTNSGTEAVEAAMKLARHRTGRQYFVSFVGSFHGRSYGSVSLTASKAKYHQGFGPLLPGVVHVPHWGERESIDYLEQVVFKRLVPAEEVAAIFVEAVLGEGGYLFPEPGWLPALRDLCTRHGILFVADEVQSGMGRTGKMWAVEQYGVEPDIVLAGKGLASGMPLGAMMARGKLMTWPMGAHGSTFGGNPVSCAAALATIDLIEKELLANATDVGGGLLRDLIALGERQPLITRAAGAGLMIGIDLASPIVADAVELAAFHSGLLTLRCGDSTIRMSPPLVLRVGQAEVGVRIFDEACRMVAERGPEAFVRAGEHEAGPDVPEGA
jgi:4-aminobutyrate aminotransferase